jgi:hypothetical protein
MSMGVYIKGMEMPTDYPLWVVVSADGTVQYNYFNEWKTAEEKAVSIPPHGDLISREWLVAIGLHLMNIAKNDDIANGVKWLWQYVIEAPTIIEAKGRE